MTLSLVFVLFLGCGGHLVRHAPNHQGAAFDFQYPPCSPALKARDEVAGGAWRCLGRNFRSG